MAEKHTKNKARFYPGLLSPIAFAKILPGWQYSDKL
jgi:hypothetical protein